MDIYDVEGWVEGTNSFSEYRSFGYAHSVKEYEALAKQVARDCFGTIYVYRIRDDGKKQIAAYMYSHCLTSGATASKWVVCKRQGVHG